MNERMDVLFGGYVGITDGKITHVTAEGAAETQGIGSVAMEKLPAAMMENNTINVDDRFPGTDMEKTRNWLRGYEQAKAAGDAQGMTVLFGLEARVPGSENDFLIFGAEPEFVLENPELTPQFAPLLEGLTKPEPQEGDLLVAVDVAADSMLPKAFEHLLGSISLRIDHHASATSFTDCELVDGGSASCAELTWDVLAEAGVTMDAKIAEATPKLREAKASRTSRMDLDTTTCIFCCTTP